MTVPVFVDTNVLVYARDASEAVKQPLAKAWLEHLWTTGDGRLSYQVLHEYYITVTRKFRPGMSSETAQAELRDLCAWQPVAMDRVVLEDAWSLESRFQLSFWDALIVASARAAGCSHLLSEDLQHDQDLDGLRVVDPFRVAPGQLS